ncbi:NUDIX domain-containing protein [Streptococcus sp. H31]|uniref:NUDIX domain-containing protein n=1 Tax=Streptococcus huangxiaojuni TaxID=3237239 RepID=UPI0034A4D5EC
MIKIDKEIIDLKDGKFKMTVSIIILRGSEILLQLRNNTGYMDGFYDLGVSGHVNSNEELKNAAVREASEELGLKILPQELTYITLIQNVKDNYVYIYFLYKISDNKRAEIKNNEPNQIKELLWARLNNLPDNLLPHNRIALKNYKRHLGYDAVCDEEDS